MAGATQEKAPVLRVVKVKPVRHCWVRMHLRYVVEYVEPAGQDVVERPMEHLVVPSARLPLGQSAHTRHVPVLLRVVQLLGKRQGLAGSEEVLLKTVLALMIVEQVGVDLQRPLVESYDNPEGHADSRHWRAVAANVATPGQTLATHLPVEKSK